jgi:NADP-dependent 3-hydroxy acid dehydrogenase YdfG
MGRATAMALADCGARLVLASRNDRALDILVDEITNTPGRALAVPTDVTDREAVARLVEATLSEYGQVDAAVITAGTNIPRRTIDELTTESWANMVAVNLTASFNITQAVLPALRERGGQLVYVSSAAAKKPDASGVAYQSTKAGLVGLAHGTFNLTVDAPIVCQVFAGDRHVMTIILWHIARNDRRRRRASRR